MCLGAAVFPGPLHDLVRSHPGFIHLPSSQAGGECEQAGWWIDLLPLQPTLLSVCGGAI